MLHAEVWLLSPQIFFTGGLSISPGMIFPLSRGLRPQFCMGSDEYESDFSWKFSFLFFPPFSRSDKRVQLQHTELVARKGLSVVIR